MATRAILLECTGVGLWFNPAGPLPIDDVCEIHVELVLASLQASRELIDDAIAGLREIPAGFRATGRRRSRERADPAPQAAGAPPSGARIAVVAPASPPQMRSGIEQATEYFESRGHEVVFGPNHRRVHGYLAEATPSAPPTCSGP